MLRLLDQGEYLTPTRRTLVHREYGVHLQILAFDSLSHFTHEFWIVKRPIVVERQSVASIEEPVLWKIHHELSLGRRPAQRVKLHAVRSAANLLPARNDPPAF